MKLEEYNVMELALEEEIEIAGGSILGLILIAGIISGYLYHKYVE